tara:strand:+ start:2895 stop:5144 length:2250 start_codon:yes stop_codon:yes gene_type:complete
MNGTDNNSHNLSTQLPNFSKDNELNLIDIWFAILRRKKLIGIITASFFFLTAFYSIYKRFSNPLFKGSFSIMIEDPFEIGNLKKSSTSMIKNDFISSTTKQERNTLIYYLKSQAVLNPFLKKNNVEKFKINIKQKKLDNKKEAKGILEVTALFRSRKQGKVLLDNLSQYYIDVALNRRTVNLTEGINFLNSQILVKRKEQTDLQKQLTDFSSKNLIADPLNDRRLLSEKKSMLIDKQENLKIDKKKLLALRESFEKGENPDLLFTELFYPSLEFKKGAEYQPIVVLQEAEAELENAKKIFKPNSKLVISLEARVLNLKKDALNAAQKLNQDRIDSISMKLDDFENEFKQLNEFVEEYEPLFKELLLIESELVNLSQLRDGLKINLSQKTNIWTIVDNASVTKNPVSPDFTKNLSLSILFGLIIGSLASVIRDRLDYVFHDIDEIKESLKIPHLSHIPYVRIFENLRDSKSSILDTITNDNLDKSNGEIKNAEYERFFYQEAFRNLYTSIRFLDTEKSLKSIVLTSSLPAEGKSLVNILFAKTLSDLGEKVLLIDADLRKPTLHTKLGINNIKGLSNLLTNKELTPSKVIQKVPGNKNWSVITAGIKPPDPTRLLSSKRLKDIILELETKSEFDLILFDTPPVSAMSDAVLVSENTSGIILLVTLFSTNRKIPLETLNRIKSSQSTILGFVSNLQKDKVINNAVFKTYEAYSDYVIDEEKENNLIENKNSSKIYEKIKLTIKNILEWIDK